MSTASRIYGRMRTRRLYRQLRKYKRIAYNARKMRDAFSAANPRGSANSLAYFGKDWASATNDQKMARRAMQFRGQGDYKSWIKKVVPDGSFSYLGRQLGGLTGIPGMNAVGSWAGNKLSKFVGFGDYGTSFNQITGGANKGQISVNETDMTGDVYIT